VYKNKACLVKGAVARWPAVQKWKDRNYWHETCKNFKIDVYKHQNYNDHDMQKGEVMEFHDAIDRLFSKEDDVFSMPSETIKEGQRFGGVLKDVKDFPFVSSSVMPRMYDHRRFFIYRKAATSWHYHNIDETLMCQVNGTKKVALLSPDIPNAKYVTDFLFKEKYLSGQTLDQSLELKPMLVTVEEGDALYIPPYWHHGVVPNDNEVGFTLAYCWRSPWHKFGNLSNYFVRKLYSDGFKLRQPISAALPFIAVYAGIVYAGRKITGK
jgi:hypothetical protein